MKYILEGVPTKDAVNALKSVIEKRAKDIVDTSLVVTGSELKFIRGLEQVIILLNREDSEEKNSIDFREGSSSFSFEMSNSTNSFFISISQNEIQFGLMIYDFNGEQILRNESTNKSEVKMLECSLSEDIFEALNLPYASELKMICEDTNENLIEMYCGSWGELKTKDLEDLVCRAR